MIFLNFVAFMPSSMQRELSSLSESLSATIYSTEVRLLSCVNALVFLEVLVEGKLLGTVLAFELKVSSMSQVVASEGKLGREESLAMIAFVNF
jgi:hypothetical protein